MENGNTQTLNMSDHDLLIVVHTKMDRVQGDIREIKDNLSGRIAMLEAHKLDKIEAEKILKSALEQAEGIHKDHEIRIRGHEKALEDVDKKIDVVVAKITTWGSVAVIAIGVIEFILSKFVFN